MLLTFALVLCVPAVALAAFPGKNGRIAFGSGGAGGEAGPPDFTFDAIQDIRPDGKGRRKIVFCRVTEGAPNQGRNCSLGGFYESAPSYSPGGRRIAFATDKARIAVASNDGRRLRLYRAGGHSVATPAFSPDAKRVVFGRGRSLYILSLRTRRVRRLVRRGAEPAWSSRNVIAFVRGGDIYSVRADGKGLRRMVRHGEQPDWSPDGRRIAFLRDFCGAARCVGPDVYVASASMGKVRRLRGTTPLNHSPAWSPDGKRIAYLADDGQRAGLYTIGTGGRGNRLVLASLAEDSRSLSYRFFHPSWQPLP